MNRGKSYFASGIDQIVGICFTVLLKIVKSALSFRHPVNGDHCIFNIEISGRKQIISLSISAEIVIDGKVDFIKIIDHCIGGKGVISRKIQNRLIGSIRFAAAVSSVNTCCDRSAGNIDSATAVNRGRHAERIKGFGCPPRDRYSNIACD